MVTLTITIPDELYERLKTVTEESSTTVDDAISSLLDGALPGPATTPVRSQADIDDERRRVREALKDITTEFNADEFLQSLGIERRSDAEVQRALEKLATLNISLSQTLIDMREEERH
ncbi:MAG TPA: hypothetical protein VMM78_06175 [Thermomicrobiales bacterium]|nr:hypothetical protein [Thermomicrobiales bacterium]